jgi:plastocyanin
LSERSTEALDHGRLSCLDSLGRSEGVDVGTWHRVVGALAGALTLALVTAGGARAAGQTTIAIPGFSYAPSSVTVNVGDAVVFQSTAGEPHSAKYDTPGPFTFDTGELVPGQSSTPIVASTAGSYEYYCGIHGRSMVGTIVVAGIDPVVPEFPWAAGGAVTAAAALALVAMAIGTRRRPASTPS